MRTKRDIPIERLTVRTCAEVAGELGISAARVSQLELSALKKLRVVFVAERIVTKTGYYKG